MPRIFNASSDWLDRNGKWNWVTLSGQDARDFLHRLTTVHVNALEMGQGSPGFFLNPQGKVRAYFTLWHFGVQSFAFELDAGADGRWKKELLSAIDQYTFAEKIQVDDVTALETRWILAEPSETQATLAALGVPNLQPGQTAAENQGEEIRICHHGDKEYGLTWISAWGRPARLQQWLERALPPETNSPIQFDEIEALRISALRPRVDAEITSNTIPLEAGLLEGIAQGKGCYPGQEVIERIVSLGSPARRLAKIEGTLSAEGAPPALGEAILNLAEPPAEVGNITSIAVDRAAKTFTALGYVRKIHAKDGLEVRIGTTNRGKITQVAPYA